jgi:hypothetical protein
MASFTLIYAALGLTVGATGMAPVAPNELPSQYLRVDSRIPYRYERSIENSPCSYPSNFSCANLGEKAYVKKQADGKERSEKKLWTGWQGRLAVCGQCNPMGNAAQKCRWRHDYDYGLPANYCSSAYFCSKDIVDGSWKMLRVFYKDDECQNYTLPKDDPWHGNNWQPVTLSNSIQPGTQPPTSCRLSGKCSSAPPQPYCAQGSDYGPGYSYSCRSIGGHNKTECFRQGGKAWSECWWNEPKEHVSASQMYHTLEKPTLEKKDVVLV